MYRCHHCGAETNDPAAWVRAICTYNSELGWFCPACARAMRDLNKLARCESCGLLFVADTGGNISNSGCLCNRCINDGLGYCAECGCLTDDLDESDLCVDCRDSQITDDCQEDDEEYNEDRRWIHEYGFTPGSLSFHRYATEDSKTDPYLGFELEVDSPDGTHPDINRLARGVTCPDISWCKHDGSLGRGFEMVSHPMTLGKHKVMSWPWRVRHLIYGGVRSYECSTCSMHVHVNREFLRRGQWFLLDDWLSDNMDFVVKVAQRHSTQYAKFHSDMTDETFSSTRAGSHRYAAINFENANTIEFRIFRGTLRAYILFKNLEFVDALVRFFKFEREHCLPSFLEFCAQQPARYAELLEFFKEKRLSE